MFCSRISMNKLNNIHEYDWSFQELLEPFNELLESSHELSIYKTSIKYSMIEVYKYLHEIMSWINDSQHPYNICNIRLFGFVNPRSVWFGVDEIALHGSQLWQKVPIKDSSSLGFFKAKIKLWSCGSFPCNLYKRFIANVGYI